MKFLFFTNYLDRRGPGCIQVGSVIFFFFFLMELFLKMESYGKPICQTDRSRGALAEGSQ